MKHRFLKLFMIPMLLLSFACSATNTKVRNLKSSITDRTYESNTRFYATVTTRRPDEFKYADKTFVRIPNAIPNGSLTYLSAIPRLVRKNPHPGTKLFRADYTIDVRFSQEGKFIFNQLFNGFVEEETYEDTKNNLFYLSTLDVLVDPGKYDIEIRYKSDARMATTKVNNVVVPDYNKFSLASPHLLHYNGKKDIDGELVDNFVTNYTNFLTDEDLIFLIELYNVKVGRIEFRFDFFKGDALKLTSFSTMIVDSAADIYTMPPVKVKVGDLKEGEYLLKIKMSDNSNNVATTKISLFKEADIIKYSTDKEWKDSIRLLGFIASHNEIKALKRLKTPKDRRDGVYNFWKNRDQGENAYIAKAYFYKRVQFVNARYGLGNKNQGWKTDRGRIYIKFGEPDDMNMKPMNSQYTQFRGKPYEIWKYEAIDRIFLFIDSSRTGTSYRLTAIYNRRGENLGLSEDINTYSSR